MILSVDLVHPGNSACGEADGSNKLAQGDAITRDRLLELHGEVSDVKRRYTEQELMRILQIPAAELLTF